MKKILWLALIGAFWASSQGAATSALPSAVVLRGPYLQNGRPDGVSILWRTDQATAGRVWYGDSPTNLNHVVDEPVSQPPLVRAGAVWRYLEDGSDPGTAWRNPGFDDSSWNQGSAQLGYGDGDEATLVGYGPDPNRKYITTYFRHSFSVTGAAGISTLELGLNRDDGAVVYLNGTEVRRDNLPSGPIGFATLATSSVGGADEATFFPSSVDPGLLVEGINVLAVEIHQADVTSSDISFDLSLDLSESAGGGDGLDHLVRLGGLDPGTTYYYQVGTAQGAVLAGGDSEHYFTSLPVPGSARPVRIWALGDSGTADNNARAVRDAYLELAATERPADVLLMLGDNAYTSGTDAEYQNAVFQGMYEGILRNRVLWSTQGNHDLGAYFAIFDLPIAGEAGGVPSGTEDYYSVDVGNVHLICLSSQDRSLSSNPDSSMYQWLTADLLATEQPWIIAFWHHPAYSKGSHDSDNAGDSDGRMRDMRTIALPLLEAGGVDLVLSGHSHSYERSMFINGHYGTSVTFDAGTHVVQAGDGDPAGDGSYAKGGVDGAVYVTAGNAGKTSGVSRHAAMQVWRNDLGSLIIDVNGDLLQVRFLRELTNPARIDDLFRISKNLGLDLDAPTPDPATWASLPAALDSTSIRMTAASASDPSGVEYRFENLTDPAHDSGWQASPTYLDTGLVPGTTYSYRVRARDRSAARNVTAASVALAATTELDLTAPSPDPMAWASAPAAVDGTSIGMTAAAATDPSGVSYRFENLTDPAHDSAWQLSATYVDSGLLPGTSYSYRVTARDLSPNHNATAPSASAAATTGLDTISPRPDPMTWASAPAATGNTSISMTATTAADPSGVEYRFVNLTDPAHTSAWQASASHTDAGLAPGTVYAYQVVARDGSSARNTTAPSTAASATTTNTQPATLFADGFESGRFDTGGWASANGDAKVHGDAAFSGVEGALLKKATWIETALSTAGHNGIRVKYVRITQQLDAGEFFHAEWWDGAAWQILESIQDEAWTQADWALPGSAGDNANLKIRFRLESNDKKEMAFVDDVEVSGVPGPPAPPGRATLPSPADAAASVGSAASLGWTAGSNADSHDVYFGTNATPGAGEFQGNQAGTSFDPGTLAPVTTYYWRIDEVNPAATTPGSVWSFTTSASPPVALFADGFESGNFDAGGWVKENGSAGVKGGSALTGSKGVELKKTTWIETAVSTEGHGAIQLSYARRTEGLDAGEFFYAEWWDGAAWHVLETTQDVAWAPREVALPASADDNGLLKIRFRLLADNDKDKAHVDDVEVTGTPN